MRKASILIASFLLLFTVSLAVGQEPQKATETTAQTEQPKNEVELKLDEYKKQGETVMGTCIVDCGEGAIQSGVESGRALELPKPVYPQIARMAHAEGTVEVRVIIDLDGTVIAAASISGHPLLQAASVAAARQARFSPTNVDGKPVRVVGVLHYNFVAQ